MGERARSISRATLLYARAVMAGVTRPEVPIMIKRVGEPTLALRSFIHKFNSHRERERVSFGGSRVTPRCSMRRVVVVVAPPPAAGTVPAQDPPTASYGNGEMGNSVAVGIVDEDAPRNAHRIVFSSALSLLMPTAIDRDDE